MARDKYKELLNYIHNELGITKSDIEQWVKEAVYEVAEGYVKNRMSEHSVDARIKNIMSSWSLDGRDFDYSVKQKAGEALASRLEIKVKDNDETTTD